MQINHRDAGDRIAVWDGTDELGRTLSAGSTCDTGWRIHSDSGRLLL